MANNNKNSVQFDQETARKLRKYRNGLGLTQEQIVEVLAEASDGEESIVSVRTYQRYEAGKTSCPAWVFKRVELLFEHALNIEEVGTARKFISRQTILLFKEKVRAYFK